MEKEDKIEKYFFHDLIDFRKQKGISKNADQIGTRSSENVTCHRFL